MFGQSELDPCCHREIVWCHPLDRCCHYLNSFQVCNIKFARSIVFDSSLSASAFLILLAAWKYICYFADEFWLWVCSVPSPSGICLFIIIFNFILFIYFSSRLWPVFFFFSSSFATVFSTAVHQPFVSVRKQFIVTDSHCEITVAVSVNSPLKTMAAVQYSKLFAQHETTRLDLEDVLWRSKDDGASRELLIWGGESVKWRIGNPDWLQNLVTFCMVTLVFFFLRVFLFLIQMYKTKFLGFILSLNLICYLKILINKNSKLQFI